MDGHVRFSGLLDCHKADSNQDMIAKYTNSDTYYSTGARVSGTLSAYLIRQRARS
jgi:hypothetical protein